MRRRAQVARALRGLLLLLFALFFLFPLYSMADFSTRNLIDGGRTLDAWKALVQDHQLFSAIIISMLLAALTVVLMLAILVPTMIWVRLRAPWATGLVNFLCLLPLTIPPLVIVVGLKTVYLWVAYFFGESALTLTFVYIVLVLPYANRAIDAALASIDLQTMAEAARSLGAGWGTTIVRVIVPNIWSGILSAAFISIAVVLGEYTVASLAGFQTTLPVVIVQIGQTSGTVSVAASLATLLFCFLLLSILAVLTRRRRHGKKGAGLEDPAVVTTLTTPQLQGGASA